MRHAFQTAALVGVLGALGAALAWASPIGENDQHFANEAAQAGKAEVHLSKLASERSQNAEVKRFAKMMIDDHTKANDQLLAISKNKGFTLRSDPNDQQRKTAERLQKLEGADFDREYSKVMLDDHKKVVALFKDQGQKCEDQELKQFAQKTLPILEGHLRHAENLVSKVGAQPKNPKVPGVEQP